jgi:hypothetical protein
MVPQLAIAAFFASLSLLATSPTTSLSRMANALLENELAGVASRRRVDNHELLPHSFSLRELASELGRLPKLSLLFALSALAPAAFTTKPSTPTAGLGPHPLDRAVPYPPPWSSTLLIVKSQTIIPRNRQGL